MAGVFLSQAAKLVCFPEGLVSKQLKLLETIIFASKQPGKSSENS